MDDGKREKSAGLPIIPTARSFFYPLLNLPTTQRGLAEESVTRKSTTTSLSDKY